jgi:hypothetical protein
VPLIVREAVLPRPSGREDQSRAARPLGLFPTEARFRPLRRAMPSPGEPLRQLSYDRLCVIAMDPRVARREVPEHARSVFTPARRGEAKEHA